MNSLLIHKNQTIQTIKQSQSIYCSTFSKTARIINVSHNRNRHTAFDTNAYLVNQLESEPSSLLSRKGTWRDRGHDDKLEQSSQLGRRQPGWAWLCLMQRYQDWHADGALYLLFPAMSTLLSPLPGGSRTCWSSCATSPNKAAHWEICLIPTAVANRHH